MNALTLFAVIEDKKKKKRQNLPLKCKTIFVLCHQVKVSIVVIEKKNVEV